MKINEKRELILPSVLIYMPTFGRQHIALSQAQNLYAQVLETNSYKDIDVTFIVSVNGDQNYLISEFRKVSDMTYLHQFNVGIILNVMFGFIKAKEGRYDYLWIIGDDEPIPAGAVNNIRRLILHNNFDLLVGSYGSPGYFDVKNSYERLSKSVGGTNSFISATIYRCDLITKDDIDAAIKFEFTYFPHLLIINRIIERNELIKVLCTPLLSICRVDQRIHGIKKTLRRSFGYSDSLVFFGKPLTLLGVSDRKYRRNELIRWWLKNWHRVSMFKDKSDFRSNLLQSVSLQFFSLIPFVLLGKIPVWRIKDIFKPL